MTSTRTRTRALAIAGLALAALAAPSAQATTGGQSRQAVATMGDYWACLALDHVEVGTCLENPLPDPSQWPPLQQIIKDLTGIG